MTTPSTSRPSRFFALKLYCGIFVAIGLLHAPLLRLPFFWDEAGFYVQAAHDLAESHSVIARSTIDTGHPPLPAAYLALWLSLAGWKPMAARVAALLLAAFGLTNVFLLARRVANTGVAVASTMATAVYPIFFVQSGMVHADLPAAAFALWGIRLGVERRLWMSQLAFSLAVLSKETAIIMPLALAAWELLVATRPHDPATEYDAGIEGRNSGRGRLSRAAIRLLPVLPLGAWLLYHHQVTGRFFGNAAFYSYNVTNTLDPIRFLLALGLRVWHLLGIMNMLAMTVATVAVMFFPAVKDGDRERPRISIPIQMQFAFIMQAHLLAYAIVGGAVLTRYLLAAYPLVIIIGMSTLRRRIAQWQWAAGAIIVFFAVALFFTPPYRIAPEDNLTWRNFVTLHEQATRFLEQREPEARILTAWPATDELSRPYLGYVAKPMPTIQVENFSLEEIYKARSMRGQYQVAYLFSTKYDQATRLHSELWDKLNRRYFDDHTDLLPQTAADLLGGRVVYAAHLGAEWVAVVEMDDSVRAEAKR